MADVAADGIGSFDLERCHRVDELEQAARAVLSDSVYDYLAGGAGDESSVRRNREALDRLLFVPRVLRAVDTVDTTTAVLGVDLSMPLLVAPTAVQRIVHADGELATARATAAQGLAMVLSMNSSVSVEDVAAEGVAVLMQLYVSRDRGHARSVVERAIAAGARGIVLTVDQAGLAVRPRELRRPLEVPAGVEFVHLPPDPASRGVDGDLTWDDVDWLRELSSVPIVIKGILHHDDARIAAEHGVDAIVVSNHGGRQLESSVSAYDVVGRISSEVGDRMHVIVDGGIRSGTDVLKALALGADAAMIGRPANWGLAVAGERGLHRVFDIVRDDFEAAMRLCGIASINQIGRACVVDSRELM